MKIFKGKKKTAPERPEICLSLGCRTMDQLEEEILKHRGYCQAVEWKVDRISGSAYYTKEEMLKMYDKVISNFSKQPSLLVGIPVNLD